MGAALYLASDAASFTTGSVFARRRGDPMTKLSTLSRSIAGKVALVTGAASGMGRATAFVLADEGAHVAVTDINDVGPVVDAITEAGGSAHGWRLDVGDAAAIARVVPAVAERFGGLDILINNAGLSAPGQIDDEDFEATWERALTVMLTAHQRTIRAALPYLRRAEHPRIVNIASTEGLGATKWNSPYAAAKTGVIGLTRALAVDLGREGITVTASAPAPSARASPRRSRGRQADLRPAAGGAEALRRPGGGRPYDRQPVPARRRVHHRRSAARRRGLDNQERLRRAEACDGRA